MSFGGDLDALLLASRSALAAFSRLLTLLILLANPKLRLLELCRGIDPELDSGVSCDTVERATWGLRRSIEIVKGGRWMGTWDDDGPRCEGVIGLDVSMPPDTANVLAGEGYVRRVTRFEGRGAVLAVSVEVSIC